METVIDKKINRRQVRLLRNNPARSAAFVNLMYVNDKDPGIMRVRKGNAVDYYFNRKKITDKATLGRIKSLVIPPAWENVWICTKPEGHLQATGIDLLKRKQYKY